MRDSAISEQAGTQGVPCVCMYIGAGWYTRCALCLYVYRSRLVHKVFPVFVCISEQAGTQGVPCVCMYI